MKNLSQFVKFLWKVVWLVYFILEMGKREKREKDEDLSQLVSWNRQSIIFIVANVFCFLSSGW